MGLKSYYRELCRFRTAMLRVKAVKNGPWQFVSLMRLRVIWFCTSLFVYGIYTLGAIYLLGGAILVVSFLAGKPAP
jgi:hypothetical protein